jgi:CubicO group peptidase (beta-lactamase class C family)
MYPERSPTQWNLHTGPEWSSPMRAVPDGVPSIPPPAPREAPPAPNPFVRPQMPPGRRSSLPAPALAPARPLALALVLALFASALEAQRFPPNAKADRPVRPSARHVSGGFAPNPEVDRLFAPWDRPDSPGCALGVLQNGRSIYERGYGMANLDYGIPNGPTMVYYIGSDSKQFTAASIALLALEGRLSLDDDIRQYIPEMSDYGTPITIRQLLHHTSGLRDIYTLMELAGLPLENVFSDSEAIALLARQKSLNFPPGTEYLYSNSGYFLLAQIVKRVTGVSLRVFADERIFRPLGMTHTHFHDDPGHVMPNRAMSYESDGRGGYRISYLQNFDKIGAGGLYSTVEDLAKWDENFYTHRVGGEPLQQLLLTRGVLANGDTIAYALGNELGRYRGLRIVEHGGSMMGYRAHILRFPDEHFTVIETCNLGSIDPGRLARAVAAVYLGDRMTPEGAELPVRSARDTAGDRASSGLAASEQLAAAAGGYYSPELDVIYHLVWADGRLTLTARHRPASPLVPAGPDTFRAGPLTLHFKRSAPGAAVTAFTVSMGRVRNIRFARCTPSSSHPLMEDRACIARLLTR